MFYKFYMYFTKETLGVRKHIIKEEFLEGLRLKLVKYRSSENCHY